MTTSSCGAKSLDRAAKDLLAVAKGVAIGRVEEIDAGFERLLDKRPTFLFVEAPGVVPAVAAAIAHVAETDARDIEAGAAELGVFHAGNYPCRNGDGEARNAANSSA